MSGRARSFGTSRPPRVLMFGPELEQRGGIATVLRTWVDAWDPTRFELRRVSTYDTHLGTLPRKLGYLPGAILRALRELVLHRPDLAHVHFSWRGSLFRKGIFLILLALFRVRPVVLHCHAGRFFAYYQERGAILRAYIRWFLRRGDHILAVSDRLAEDISSLVPEIPVEVLYNPVPLPEVEVAGRDRVAAASTERGTDGVGVRSLTLGDVGAAKGSLDLVAVAASLSARGVDATFELGGDGELEAVRAAAAERGLGDRVRLLGWLGPKAKDRAFRSADVYLLPSYMEGFPVSVIEAMAHGLPVVSTSVGGIPELVQDGDSGILLEPGDVEGIAGAVETLALDPELRSRMGRAGRRRVVELCSPERIMSRLLARYDELLASRAEGLNRE
jgi:glycosyltransferase involved in cell wall biosynthesis